MSSLFSPKRFGDGSARAFLLRFSFHGNPLSIEFPLQEMECQVDSVSSSPISKVQLLHGDENIVLNAVKTLRISTVVEGTNDSTTSFVSFIQFL